MLGIGLVLKEEKFKRMILKNNKIEKLQPPTSYW